MEDVESDADGVYVVSVYEEGLEGGEGEIEENACVEFEKSDLGEVEDKGERREEGSSDAGYGIEGELNVIWIF